MISTRVSSVELIEYQSRQVLFILAEYSKSAEYDQSELESVSMKYVS